MRDRSSVAAVAEWMEADARRGRLFFAGIAAVVHIGAVVFWAWGGTAAVLDRTGQIVVIGIWAMGLVPVVRLLSGPVAEERRTAWLVLDGTVTLALVIAVQDTGNPLVFQRAMMPIAVAFMLTDRRLLGWWMSGAFGVVLLAAAAALPALGVWDPQNRGLWVFWAAIPLVLCSGPFMLIANGRREYTALRELRDDRDRLQAEARRLHRAELDQQASLRAHVRLHSREVGWLVDVAGTLAEHAGRITDPDLRRRLIELKATTLATEDDALGLLRRFGGLDA